MAGVSATPNAQPIAIQAFSATFQAGPLIWVDLSTSGIALDTRQIQPVVFILLRLSAEAFDIYLIFFGFWCFLVGYLIFVSGFLPKILGALEIIAGFCWLTFLWPPVARHLSPYNQRVAGLAELSLTVWLLVMAVDAQRWHRKMTAQAT